MKRGLWLRVVLSTLVLGIAPLAQAQAYADQWWETIIQSDRGTFAMGDGVNFTCRRGQGDLTVTVSASGTPDRTTVEFRNGGNYHRSLASKNDDGHYSFTIPGNRTSTIYHLLTGFSGVNINVEAAGPIYVETGAPSGSPGPTIMRNFCASGSSNSDSSSSSSSNSGSKSSDNSSSKTVSSLELPASGGKPMSCGLERKAKSKNGLGTVTLQIVNQTQSQRAIFRIDTNGNRRLVSRLLPGEATSQSTRRGHVWMATNLQGRCRQMLVVQSGGGFAVVR